MTQKNSNKNIFVAKLPQSYIAIFFIVFAFIWISIVIYSSYFIPALDDQNTSIFTSSKQIYFRYGFNQLHMTNPFFIAVFIGFIFSLFTVRQDVGEPAPEASEVSEGQRI